MTALIGFLALMTTISAFMLVLGGVGAVAAHLRDRSVDTLGGVAVMGGILTAFWGSILLTVVL